MGITIYGIKNCDTMKKARAWLDKQRRRLRLPRLQDAPASSAAGSKAGSKKAGWETLLNRAGTTFRKLPDKDKDGLTEKKAIALMLAQPSMIKRPVLELPAASCWSASSRSSTRKHLAKMTGPSGTSR